MPEELSEGNVLEIGAEARSLAGTLVGLFFLINDLSSVGLWALGHIWDAVRWTLPSNPFYSGYFGWLLLVRIPCPYG